MRNEDGNTPLAYACLRGNLQIVKLLHGKGAIMNQKNQANLTPLMLAIYNSHFFVVHYLLGILLLFELCIIFFSIIIVNNLTIIHNNQFGIESVVESVNSSFDLYRVLQFGISCLSSQIFFLLVEVFTNKIEEMQLRYGFTVWELKFNIQDALLHQQIKLIYAFNLHIFKVISIYQMQDGGRTFDDNSVSQIDQQSNSMMTYRDYGTANGMHLNYMNVFNMNHQNANFFKQQKLFLNCIKLDTLYYITLALVETSTYSNIYSNKSKIQGQCCLKVKTPPRRHLFIGQYSRTIIALFSSLSVNTKMFIKSVIILQSFYLDLLTNSFLILVNISLQILFFFVITVNQVW